MGGHSMLNAVSYPVTVWHRSITAVPAGGCCLVGRKWSLLARCCSTLLNLGLNAAKKKRAGSMKYHLSEGKKHPKEWYAKEFSPKRNSHNDQ
eukprot:2823108-Amphidinium_carterae.1